MNSFFVNNHRRIEWSGSGRRGSFSFDCRHETVCEINTQFCSRNSLHLTIFHCFQRGLFVVSSHLPAALLHFPSCGEHARSNKNKCGLNSRRHIDVARSLLLSWEIVAMLEVFSYSFDLFSVLCESDFTSEYNAIIICYILPLHSWTLRFMFWGYYCVG